MRDERKPKEMPKHVDKTTIDQPQEEFVADESIPSKDISEVQKKPRRSEEEPP